MQTLSDALRSRTGPEATAALLAACWTGLERTRGQYGPEKIQLQGDLNQLSDDSLTARVKPGSASELGPHLAPEVAWGRGGAPAVVYLVSALMYERLAGAPPFPNAPAEALQVRKLLEPVPTLPPGVPAALAGLVLKGLAPRAEDRCSLAELRGALQALSASPISPPSPAAPAPMVPIARPARPVSPARKVASAVDEFPSMAAAQPRPAPVVTPAPAPAVKSRLWMGLGCAALPALAGTLGLLLTVAGLLLRARGAMALGTGALVGLGGASVAGLLVGAGLAAASFIALRPRSTPPLPEPAPAAQPPRPKTPSQNWDEEASIAADPPEDGFRPFSVGPYWCFGRLGEGAMGVVYRSRHMKLGRLAAVKVLAPRVALQPANLAWFKREARLAARIRHPNVVNIYDFGDIDGSLYYIAMEHVHGAQLTTRIAAGAMPTRDVVSIVAQVASGLDAAHASGVIHRDLKPDNIVVHERAGTLTATIVDFGIARQGGAGSQDTAAMVVGTPPYMSPEQARGEGELDSRTDLFALGVLTYEMLTGKLPFGAHDERPVKVLLERGRLSEPPESVTKLRPDLPAAVDRALEGALAPAREQRYASAGAFEAELRAALQI